MNDTKSKAATSKIFDVALSSLVNFHNNFVSNSFKLAALLTVVIGWIISSEAAREFLRSAHVLLWVTILGSTVLSAIVSYINFRNANNISKKLHGNLVALGYMNETYFEHYAISSRLYSSMLLLVMVLYVVLLMALSYIRI